MELDGCDALRYILSYADNKRSDQEEHEQTEIEAMTEKERDNAG